MIIRKSIAENIFRHAEREAPVEACGYLAGQEGVVTRDYPMTNVDGREDHFSFDPQEQFTVHRAAREEGLRILAVYHSHPASPARPSPEDIKLAYDPTLVYVILSLLDGKRIIRGFHIRQGTVEEEPFVIEENP